MIAKAFTRACFAAALAGVLTLAGCGAPPSGSQPNPGSPNSAESGSMTATNDGGLEPADGDWAIARFGGEPANLNPITSSDAGVSDINAFIFETLLEYDNATLAKKPRVADKWDISPDHLTYTFYLKKNGVFSDGTPLTANDVKFSFDKVMDPAVDAAHLRNYYKDITACDVIDDYTVRFTAKQPYVRHLIMLGDISILPQHLYSQGDFNQSPYNRKPVGSGPYVFESWDTGSQITLARNEKYWRDKPRIMKRVFRFIIDPNAAFQVLNRQEVDMMNLSPELWVNRASNADFEAKFNKFKYYSSAYSYIGWNMRHPQFQDKMVRRAMTFLLNRKQILETIYYGLGKQVVSEFFVESPEYDKSILPWPYDPDQAKKLLDAAGWVDSKGSGVREKDGVPFQFEMLIRSGSPDDERVATVYQEELRKAGIAMSIRALEWATFLERVDSRNFDAVRLGWSEPPIEGDPYQVWHSSQAEKGSNYVGFVNAEADKLMDDARLEFDDQKRIALYHKFNAILHEEQPYTFLFCIQTLEALDKRFHGVRVYKAGMDSREWWVPANLQRYK
jgi:peptide/nickel transport system substrate-binding protein